MGGAEQGHPDRVGRAERHHGRCRSSRPRRPPPSRAARGGSARSRHAQHAQQALAARDGVQVRPARVVAQVVDHDRGARLLGRAGAGPLRTACCHASRLAAPEPVAALSSTPSLPQRADDDLRGAGHEPRDARAATRSTSSGPCPRARARGPGRPGPPPEVVQRGRRRGRVARRPGPERRGLAPVASSSGWSGPLPPRAAAPTAPVSQSPPRTGRAGRAHLGAGCAHDDVRRLPARGQPRARTARSRCRGWSSWGGSSATTTCGPGSTAATSR